MRVIFLQNLGQVTFEGAPSTETAIGLGLQLTTNPESATALLTGLFAPAVSAMDLQASSKCGAHILGHGEYVGSASVKAHMEGLTQGLISITTLFLEALWLVKDNSANTSAAYSAVVDNAGRPVLFHLPHSAVTSTARCTMTTTAFGLGELQEACMLFRQLIEVMPREIASENAPRPMAMIHASRLGRALFVIQGARSTSDVALKVAFYCIAFETLFSTVREGVSRCVSERASCFLGGDPIERKTNFKRFAKLYGYRSAVVHGSRIDTKKENSIREAAVLADDHVRRTLRKILTNPNLTALFSADDKSALDKYFVEHQ